MILTGNALHLPLGTETVSAVVTDPPYGLDFMGKDWDHGVPGIPFWEEAMRVALPGAHLLAFGGTRTHHRLVCAIEDAGWEIRDCLKWVYGSGFPKSHNLQGEWDGWGTALKPAYEPITLARKPFRGSVADNVAEHGTGALNIDGCRIGDEQDGRWPANLLHDGGEEVRRFFPDAKGQQGAVTGNEPSPKMGAGGCYGSMRHRPPSTPRDDADTSSARFFYCAKASRAEREAGLHDLPATNVNDGRSTSMDNPYQRGDTQRRNTHPTVKPIAVNRWLVRLVAPPGGLVIDQFCGSGSTGIACGYENAPFVGMDINPEYTSIAAHRIAWHAVNPLPLPGRITAAPKAPPLRTKRQRDLF